MDLFIHSQESQSEEEKHTQQFGRKGVSSGLFRIADVGLLSLRTYMYTPINVKMFSIKHENMYQQESEER